MYAKLTTQERLKDLRVIDKHLTLEQLAEQTGLSRSPLVIMNPMILKTSARMPLRRSHSFTV